MIPLKVESVTRRAPVVTVVLILLCIGAFLAQARLAAYGYGFVPVDFMYSLLHPGKETIDTALTLLLSFFQHAGILHLAVNMWSLWIYGVALERAVGPLRYGTMYLVCGVLSMIIQAASSPLSSTPVVGASGAIAGVMGACLVLLPLARMSVWIPPIFVVRIPALLLIVPWIVSQYMSVRRVDGGDNNVAWWAHIGGFICGALLAIELRRRGWKPAQHQRQAPKT
jgi:membrane associated rhomboid family serine protease